VCSPINQLEKEFRPHPQHKLILGAFDCSNHDILLSKFNFCGITDKAYEQIKSYIRYSYQQVEIKDKKFSHKAYSDWRVIKYGVP